MKEMMGTTDIAFPHLGIYLENVGKNISVFGFTIAYYGIIIALGILAGIFLATRLAKEDHVNPDTIWDFAIYGVIFSIIGARIYYVAFAWDYYKDNLLQIFNMRQGGGAIYGSIIAAFLTLLIYSKIKKVNYLQICDICVPGLALGQAIGRWGNFFNREVFGSYTDNLFAMRLPIEAVRARDINDALAATILDGTNYIQVHPTFLYESVWNLALVVIMCLYITHKKFHGEVALIYLVGYGLGRAWIEAIRTDQLYIRGTTIPVSLALSLVIVAAGVAVWIVKLVKIRKTGVGAATEKSDEITGKDVAK
ncbi:MAG: prolipoprotein diacylglyceryl transferase [Lachnospiraceae bacterium]|nr:prolipoprotein diacylglyceryl transferase [Lachnospiraceae bacterium]